MDFPIEEEIPLFPSGFNETLNTQNLVKADQMRLFENEGSLLSEKRISGLNQTNYSSVRNEETFDSHTLKNINYHDLFVLEKNSTKLIAKFDLEKKELLKGSNGEISYSLEECKIRAQKGYYIFKYSFNMPKRSVISIKISDYYIELNSGKTIKKIRINSLHGILFGAVSTTFSNFKKIIEQRESKIHKFYHCFSLVSEFRTYDFGTVKENDKLDICVCLS